MDEDIARWILEFLLRQPSISDRVLDSLLSTLPLSNTDSRLKKTLVLRRIKSECSDGTISESILEFLERIEELDYQAGKEVTCSELMKAAYCAVAVDCTVRFLEEDGENDGGKYFEKVQSVWRGRVSELEKSENCLVSVELLSWRDKVEIAIWNSDLCCNILMRNTRNEALKALRLYVREAWRELGPTFLEIAAENEMVKKMVLNGSQELGGCSTDPGTGQVVEEKVSNAEVVEEVKVGNVVNTCPELVGYDHNVVIGGANGSFGVEAERGGARHGGEISTMGKPPVSNEVGSLEKQSPLGCEDVALHGRRSREAGTGRSRGDKIADTNGVQEVHTQSNQYHNGPNPEVVRKVHEEAPRSSFTKLSRVVNDPNPEAMRMAETVSLYREAEKVDSDVAVQNKKRGGVSAAATTGDNGDRAAKNDGSVDDVAAEDTHRKENASAAAERGNVGDQIPGQKNYSPPEKTRPPKRSSTDTAHVFEWDGSIAESASGSSIRFDLPPSPKRRTISPLKKAEFLKLTRRQKKRWTADEEEALRTGVEKFGVGNWKFIHSAYHSRFQDRTECDLKDKWRNLTKSSR